MYEETKAKIRESAPLIWALWKQGLRPDTEPPYSTALKLLDEIDDTPLGLKDLAKILDLHTNTVSEYLNALKQGGVPIKVSGAGSKKQATGRQEARYWIEK